MNSIIPSGAQSPFEHLKQIDPDRGEYWSARDLQSPMGYDRWERFESAIERAVAACQNSGASTSNHFRGAAKNPSGLGGRPSRDWLLSRYAAYLVAMNGDPRKPEVAAAQTYFAVRTREAEVTAASPALPQDYEEALAALLNEVREKKMLAAQVAELGPAAQSWNVLASGDGDYAVADAAKILARDPGIQLGRNRLFTVLLEQRWTYRQGIDDRPRAMQSAVERGWLSEIPQSHYHPRTGELVLDPPQVRVTVKGLQELHGRLGGEGALRLPEVTR